MDKEAVEQEIKNIRGNEAVLYKLYELLESGDAIAFAGSGVSAEIWPLWNPLLQELTEYTKSFGKINQPEADFFLRNAIFSPLETAQQIRDKLGDKLYFEFLQDTFSDKMSLQTGCCFTTAQQALIQLPVRNFMTLNYDAGLTNARAVFYPNATTSYYFWDQEESRRIREKGVKKQIMHVHGRYDRSDTIILTLDDYYRCYNHRPFYRLINEIFAFENLIFIGFGLSDPNIKYIFEAISNDYRKSPLHHVAIVGLDKNEMQVSHLLREKVEMTYGAHILFYPTDSNHEKLNHLLSMLVNKYTKEQRIRSVDCTTMYRSTSCVDLKIPDAYIHQPTDDENFKGRLDDFQILNRWAMDPATKTIAITGIGGQGKTALVGRWLKTQRNFELSNLPVFYWSFYENPDFSAFIRMFLDFFLPLECFKGNMATEAISFIFKLVKKFRIFIVLDGMEIFQYDPSNPDHNRINHPQLDLFLKQWLRYPHNSLVILTSRFRFLQLEYYLGIGFHILDLDRLKTEDGIALLDILGVLGEKELKTIYVEAFNGHPLALRILSSIAKCFCCSDLAKFENSDFINKMVEEDRLYKKLKHLFEFYEKLLSEGQKELLGIISLLKRPIALESFIALIKKMSSLQNTPLFLVNDDYIKQQVTILSEAFLIEISHIETLTTHPVIRDHFRNILGYPGLKHEVAAFFQSKPCNRIPQNIEDVRDLVEAVQLLCEEGDFKTANHLYIERLCKGGYDFNVFRQLPAIAEGLACDFAFIGSEERIVNIEKDLGKGWVSYFYAGVALYNATLGNLAQSLTWYKRAMGYRTPEILNQIMAYGTISYIYKSMGQINDAIDTIKDCIKKCHEVKNITELKRSYGYKACYEFLRGNVEQAYIDFETALLFTEQDMPKEGHLCGYGGLWLAEFMLKIGQVELFESINSWNMKYCKETSCNQEYAICILLSAWSHIMRNEHSQAEKLLEIAESIIAPSGIIELQCQMNLIWALLENAKNEYLKGLQNVNDSLRLCADKGYKLLQSDLLIMRGNLYIHQFEATSFFDKNLLEKAGDDGFEALKIAEHTGYVWAIYDSLILLANYKHIKETMHESNYLTDLELSKKFTENSEMIKNKLKLTKQQLKKLKIKARHEFNIQTLGWDFEELRKRVLIRSNDRIHKLFGNTYLSNSPRLTEP